jgi:hypothetical protein
MVEHAIQTQQHESPELLSSPFVFGGISRCSSQLRLALEQRVCVRVQVDCETALCWCLAYCVQMSQT